MVNFRIFVNNLKFSFRDVLRFFFFITVSTEPPKPHSNQPVNRGYLPVWGSWTEFRPNRPLSTPGLKGVIRNFCGGILNKLINKAQSTYSFEQAARGWNFSVICGRHIHRRRTRAEQCSTPPSAPP